jgi:DNA-binding phage protein
MTELTMVQRFSQARVAFNDSAQQVADNIGCSREYLYEVLKYPNKNPEIFNKACEYIKSAGVRLPDDNNNVAPQPA